MASPSRFDAVVSIWYQRNFAWYTGGAVGSLFGLWAQRIAVGWLAWQLTKSPTWLGLIAFADLFPTVVVTPFAGVLADRMNRRTMSIVSQGLAGLQAFALAALTFTGLIDIWWLFGLTLFLGIVMAFATAARLSMVPTLLERQYVPTAVAIDSALFNLARVVGPMMAAGIIAWIGVGGAFLINGVTFAVFVVCLFQVQLLRVETGARETSGILEQTAAGLRYALGHPGIGPMLVSLTALAVGVKPILDLLPAVADTLFGRGVDGFALLAAAGGAGAVTTALFLAMRGSAEGLTRVTLSSLVVGAVGVFILCISDIFWVGLLGAYIAGGSITLSGAGTQTLMQNAVDGAMRGRVMSVYAMLHRGAPALGALGMGVLSEVVGLQIAIGGGAVLLCLAALIWILPRRGAMIPALERGPHGEYT